MKIRDQLICRIIEDGLIKDNVIKNYDIMQLSNLIHKQPWDFDIKKTRSVTALPDSIMRNFRSLADEYDLYNLKNIIKIQFAKGMNVQDVIRDGQDREKAYQFQYKTKKDYKLTDGFIKWLGDEYKKLRGKGVRDD